jgi:serine/threonine protein kinase
MLGRFLLDQYKILRKLGQGGFGAVYEAFQPSLDRKVAIKVLHPNLTQNPDVITRFRREGLIATRLKHPSTIEVFTLGQTEDGYLWLAMEFIEGQTLEHHIRQHQTLSPKELIEIISPVCEVLAEAHSKGIVHRDLKPDNIMMCIVEGTRTSKVLDFGISSLHGADSATHAAMVSGTPQYMAPEQWEGLAMVDSRSDIYSLGIILYRALSNQLPFEAESPLAWMKKHTLETPMELATAANHLPEELCRVVMRALSKEPELRQQSALQLKEELLAAIQNSADVTPYAAKIHPPTYNRLYVSNTNDRLLSVVRYGSELFAVGENGIILRSRDEDTWELLEGPTMVALQCIISYPHGLCIVGAGGVVLCSREGTHWEQRPTKVRSALCAAWGDNDCVFVVGQFGVVLRSTDQGRSFQPLQVGCRDTLFAVWGVEAGGHKTIFAAGFNGVLLRSTNLGESWQRIALGTNAMITDIHGRSEKEVHLTTGSGTLFSSSDGERFTQRELRAGEMLRKVRCLSDGTLAILSGASCYQGWGDEWQQHKLSERELIGMFVEEPCLYFCGSGNEIIRVTRPEAHKTLFRGTFPHLRSITTIPGGLMLGGYSGAMPVSHDGGGEWKTEQLNDLADITCTHQPEGGRYYYTAGHNKHFAVFEGDEERWDLVTSESVYWIWSSSPEDVYAIGERGTIIHTADSGGMLEGRESGVQSTLLSMWGDGPEVLYIVGAGGVILRSQDRGYFWEKLESSTQKDLHCIKGFGGELFACGEEGLLLYSNNQGETWQKRYTGTKETLTHISGTLDDLFLCGTNGTLLHSQDKGQVWRAWPTPTIAHLAGAVRTSDSVIVFGSHGLLLYYQTQQESQFIGDDKTLISI